MCFGSTIKPAARPVAIDAASTTQAGIARDTYQNVANKLDDEYVRADDNKKGRRTVEAFDVLGTLVRARRDGNDARVREVLDEYVSSFR